MDANALAAKLGVTPKTVRTRARSLGIVGTQTKTEGREGRPATVYSPQECDRISNYGKAQEPLQGEAFGSEDDAIDVGAMVLNRAISAPLSTQLATIAAQLEAVEDTGSDILAARIAAMPNRLMLKTAQKLQGYESVDLSAIVGILGSQPLTLPARKITFDASLI